MCEQFLVDIVHPKWSFLTFNHFSPSLEILRETLAHFSTDTHIYKTFYCLRASRNSQTQIKARVIYLLKYVLFIC